MKEIPTSYDPQKIEKKWYDFWKERNFFQANPKSSKPPFSIVMPPPNVTGILHMGHVLGTTLQDLVSRYKRMQGYEVLWVPGTDHAGIATQTVVERNLLKNEGKKRRDLDRDTFEKLCWDWTHQHQNNISSQIEALGASADFSRQKFTLDSEINFAVKTLFKKLFDQNLIYRGYYLVNWDPLTQTALADDEVEFEERVDKLYTIRYPLADAEGDLLVATTRPETLFGDTAVAISAKDERFNAHLGQKVKIPLVNREIPIIADHYVDPEFGTGAVKITPAHDPNDYEVGQRHDLAMINLLNPNGTLNENAEEFEGLSTLEARHQVAKRLKKEGYLVKEEPYTHRVGISYRSKAVIEPYLSKQWFVRMSAFKESLKKAVSEGQVKLYPQNWENTYYHWIDNLRDWCVSRQLWWGHRIPIWYHKDNPDEVICHIDEGLPEQVQKNPQDWVQEEDVLDTWFSSALWPFSTLGWPNQTDELKKFYPNSLMITGHDILFFWVARMMMMGEYALGQLPFPEVILTGLIYGKSYWRTLEDGSIQYVDPKERLKYDLGEKPPKGVHSKWEKISKSKGNAIDPKEISDLYGTCAMRMALCSTSCQLRQIDLDRRRFEEFKNFTNKVWNGARFALLHLQDFDPADLQKGLSTDHLLLEDRWILMKLDEMIEQVTQSLDTYAFDHAANKAYEFFWNEFCAYYLEISKPYLFGKEGQKHHQDNKKRILFITLMSSIRVLHPMAPFITEELFQTIKELFPKNESYQSSETLTHEALVALSCPSVMVSSFPKPFGHENLFEGVQANFDFVQELVYTIRNIRGEMKIAPHLKTQVFFEGPQIDLIQEHAPILKALTPIESFHYEPCSARFFSQASLQGHSIAIPLPKELLTQEKKRLEKEKLKKEQSLQGLEQKLKNPNFIERAPKELIEKQKTLHEEQEKELATIEQKLKELEQL